MFWMACGSCVCFKCQGICHHHCWRHTTDRQLCMGSMRAYLSDARCSLTSICIQMKGATLSPKKQVREEPDVFSYLFNASPYRSLFDACLIDAYLFDARSWLTST